MKGEKLGAEIQAATLYRVERGDFVYSRLFAWKGSFAIASSSDDGCFVSNEFPCFHPDLKHLDPEFLRYYFSQQHVWLEALGLSSGSTPTSRNRLKESQLLSMRISLPPLEEQRRIVARVEALAVRIEEARGLRESLMYTFRQLLGAEFNRVSVSAIYRPLGEIAPAVRRTVQLELHRKYKEVGARSFGKGLFVKPDFDAAEATWQKPVWLEQGDVVLSNIKAWEGAIAVAKPEHHLHIASHRYITLVPTRDVVDANFLCFYLLTSEGLERIGSASPGTADRNRTTGLRALEQIRVPVPPLQKQKQFVKLLESQNAVRDLQTSTRLELDALLPAVLAKAFAGEL